MQILRTILLTATLVACLSAHASCEELISPSLMPDSLATHEQLQAIISWVKPRLGSRQDNSALIRELNQLLHEFGLPTIHYPSPDLLVAPSYIHGSFGNTYVGVEIRDGVHRFCFPCNKGWNGFEMGLVPYAKSKRNEAGKYFALINAVEKTARYRRNGQTNAHNWPVERLASFVIDSPAHRGVVIVRDDALEFYPAPLPGSASEKVPEPKPNSLWQRLFGSRVGSSTAVPAFSFRAPILSRLQPSNHPEILILTCTGLNDNHLAAEFKISESGPSRTQGPILPVEIETSEMENAIVEHLHSTASALREPDRIMGDHSSNSLVARCERLSALIQIPATTFATPQFEIYRRDWMAMAREMDCPAPAQIGH